MKCILSFDAPYVSCRDCMGILCHVMRDVHTAHRKSVTGSVSN